MSVGVAKLFTRFVESVSKNSLKIIQFEFGLNLDIFSKLLSVMMVNPTEIEFTKALLILLYFRVI